MDRYSPLRARTITLVGLMGVGKSSVGRRLANALDLPFKDADVEIEAAAGRSIPDIFAEMGEPAFREGERRVITRLLENPPHVLATGGTVGATAKLMGQLGADLVHVSVVMELGFLDGRAKLAAMGIENVSALITV